MSQYEGNITSVLAQFPSQQIAGVIDRFVLKFLYVKQDLRLYSVRGLERSELGGLPER